MLLPGVVLGGFHRLPETSQIFCAGITILFQDNRVRVIATLPVNFVTGNNYKIK